MSLMLALVTQTVCFLVLAPFFRFFDRFYIRSKQSLFRPIECIWIYSPLRKCNNKLSLSLWFSFMFMMFAIRLHIIWHLRSHPIHHNCIVKSFSKNTNLSIGRFFFNSKQIKCVRFSFWRASESRTWFSLSHTNRIRIQMNQTKCSER